MLKPRGWVSCLVLIVAAAGLHSKCDIDKGLFYEEKRRRSSLTKERAIMVFRPAAMALAAGRGLRHLASDGLSEVLDEWVVRAEDFELLQGLLVAS